MQPCFRPGDLKWEYSCRDMRHYLERSHDDAATPWASFRAVSVSAHTRLAGFAAIFFLGGLLRLDADVDHVRRTVEIELAVYNDQRSDK